MHKKTFTVGIIGFSEYDTRVLRSIFSLSAIRDRTYVATESLAKGAFEILMVGKENETAIAKLKSTYCDTTGTPKLPTVLVGKNRLADPRYYNLTLPLRGIRVLSKLDQLTIKEFNFIPELVIGREDKQQLSEEMLNKVLPAQNADAREIRMLVVDDSEPVRKQLEIQLNMLGMRTELAESAERAMELIKERRYACIFLDVVMPGADGYSVCKAVKRDSRLKQTPVVMLTSKSSPFDRVKGKLAGCNAYLTKPVEREAFAKVIKPYLNRSVATTKII
ncbi:MAG: response regulator [Gammaproteobacteria bacterium]|nr:response regulator [Gammaproteobacteria bacterium]